MSNATLKKLVSHMWEMKIDYNRDNSIKRIRIDLRPTCSMSPEFSKRTLEILEDFAKEAKGAI